MFYLILPDCGIISPTLRDSPAPTCFRLSAGECEQWQPGASSHPPLTDQCKHCVRAPSVGLSTNCSLGGSSCSRCLIKALKRRVPVPFSSPCMSQKRPPHSDFKCSDLFHAKAWSLININPQKIRNRYSKSAVMPWDRENNLHLFEKSQVIKEIWNPISQTVEWFSTDFYLRTRAAEYKCSDNSEKLHLICSQVGNRWQRYGWYIHCFGQFFFFSFSFYQQKLKRSQREVSEVSAQKKKKRQEWFYKRRSRDWCQECRLCFMQTLDSTERSCLFTNTVNHLLTCRNGHCCTIQGLIFSTSFSVYDTGLFPVYGNL